MILYFSRRVFFIMICRATCDRASYVRNNHHESSDSQQSVRYSGSLPIFLKLGFYMLIKLKRWGKIFKNISDIT